FEGVAACTLMIRCSQNWLRTGGAMDKEAIKKLKSRYILLWTGSVLCAILTIFLLVMGEVLLGMLLGALIIVVVPAMIMYSKLLKGDIRPYVPRKGFWYYRLSPQNKITYLSVSQLVFFLLLIVFWLFDLGTWYATFTALGGIVYIQFVIKRRIKLHTPVDDASLFELEELGIIASEESVVGLYKDFTSWSDVHEGAKIVVLTPDHLILIRMVTPEEGERYELRLKEIAGLFIMADGRYGQGMILTFRMANETSIRLTLLGESAQDSPEQFIYALLNSLDRVNMEAGTKAKEVVLVKANRPAPAHTSFSNGAPRPVIRHLDLPDFEPSIKEPGLSPEAKEISDYQDKGKGRQLDF
ncbi:MAG: hypothetical protein E6Z15_16350, partial [Paenibacillus macerans]|nr:hypothetical protein [Paenibacillus macerans]